MARFIVVGGGVIGLNTAYQLASKRFHKVVLLEKGQVGEGASSRAGGIITGLLWTEAGVLARRTSLRLYQELSADLGCYGYCFQNVGCLNLFDGSLWAQREALLPLYDRLDFPYEILDADEMGRRWPDLVPAADHIGLYDPLGGYSEPHEFVPALARRCRDRGVEIYENVRVRGLQIENGRAVGVETGMGMLAGDVVICTVHVWTRAFMAQFGLQLPVKSFVHQRYVSAELPGPVAIPAINANPQGGYIRPARLGTGDFRLLAGGETEEQVEYLVDDLAFHMSALSAPASVPADLSANLTPLLPKLAGTKWETEQVGLISFSGDGEPILGSLPQLPGLVFGTAFHSGGFAYSPVAGLLLAELAAGEKTSIDISSFAPDRFAVDGPDAMQAPTMGRRH